MLEQLSANSSRASFASGGVIVGFTYIQRGIIIEQVHCLPTLFQLSTATAPPTMVTDCFDFEHDTKHRENHRTQRK